MFSSGFCVRMILRPEVEGRELVPKRDSQENLNEFGEFLIGTQVILVFWLLQWNNRHCLANKHVPVVPFLKFVLRLLGPLGMFSEELFSVVALIWGDFTCQQYIPLAHSPQNGVCLVAARCARWSCGNECCWRRSLFTYSCKIIHRHGNLVIFQLEELKCYVLFQNVWVQKPLYEVKQ